MSFDYARSRAMADRMLANAGRAAILRRPTSTGTAYDPTAGTPVDFAVTIFTDEWSFSERTGGRVQVTDQKILMAAGGLTEVPTPSHKLVIDGAEHQIIGPDKGLGVKPLSPAGVTVLYMLQARR